MAIRKPNCFAGSSQNCKDTALTFGFDAPFDY